MEDIYDFSWKDGVPFSKIVQTFPEPMRSYDAKENQSVKQLVRSFGTDR